MCREGPRDVIRELAATWVTLPPLAPMAGYVCIVAKSHGPEPYQLPVAERVAFWEDVNRVAAALDRGLRPDKLNYEIHGNTLPHLHLHLFPRQQGDRFQGQPINGRDAHPRSDEELAAIMRAIQGIPERGEVKTSGDHPDSPPGKADKYARRERERRFLLVGVPTGKPVRRVLIEDRYLVGTRLRLRRVTPLETQAQSEPVIYKLTQKVPAPHGGPGLITTLYLSATEYQALTSVPARTLEKVRSSIPPFGVDEFRGALAGLVLAEAEFESDADSTAFEPAIPTIAEVTADDRFTGGRLAQTDVDEMRALLTLFGIGSAPRSGGTASIDDEDGSEKQHGA